MYFMQDISSMARCVHQGASINRTTDNEVQLGVLAWCSEFSELIDALKELGFQGNMFVATRSQALRTCEEIMRLKLDIEMQIIVMYLSSQVRCPS